jgi:hypothetical protein
LWNRFDVDERNSAVNDYEIISHWIAAIICWYVRWCENSAGQVVPSNASSLRGEFESGGVDESAK